MERIEEAKKCNDCVSWHKYCNAECCRYISLGVSKESLNSPGNYISFKIKREFTASDLWYYSLRDVKYRNGILKFKKDRIKVVNNELVYFYPCKKLKDNLCIGHPNNKPKICRDFVFKTCGEKGYMLTENCLFKYKLQGGKK